MNLTSSLFAAAMVAGIGGSQTLLPGLSSNGIMRLSNDDFAVLEMQEPRTELPCTVTPTKPVLEFDFAFHSGFEVRVPIKELAGSGDDLTILFRVVPQNHENKTIYMSQELHVPPLEESGKAEGAISGAFVLGEGRYHVDWLMRDQHSRVCANFWDVEAKLSPKDMAVKAWIPNDTSAQPQKTTFFGEEPPVRRATDTGLFKVDILVNFAPQKADSAILDNSDLQGLVGILRRIARDPRIGEYSLVAFSLQTQQVLYRQEGGSRINFPALGDALKALHLGRVDAKNLTSKNGLAEFVAKLVGEQSKVRGPDALIIVGPKSGPDAKMPREILDTVQDFDRPVFYLNYDAVPELNPWQDLVGNVVKRKRGVKYTITQPKDLFRAWSDLISRTAQAKYQTVDKTSAKNASGL